MVNDALASLIAAEERERLWDRRIAGYPIWGLMRLERYRSALLDGETVIRAGPVPSRREVLKRLARTAGQALIQGRPPNNGRDIWVISSSTYRRRTSEGAYPCIFVEHLREQLGHRLLFMEVNTAGLPIADRDDVYLLDGCVQHINAWASALAAGVARAAVSENDLQAFAPAPAKALVRTALYGHMLERLAAGLLRTAAPRAVFVLCGYASMIPFQRAVRRAGIPLIELQHGVIHDSHPGYIFQASVPERDHRPDHILLFGRHFGEILDRNSPGLASSWSVAGHPWLRRVRAAAHTEPPSLGRPAEEVVVFGQYDPPIQAQLKTFVPELRRALSPRIRLVYKPHPREPIGPLEAAFRVPGLSIADPSDDAYALLNRCVASVTVHSTLAIEALAFPCRSIVIRSPQWSEDIASLVQQGTLYPAESAEDVVRIIAAPLEREGGWAGQLFGTNDPEPDFLELIERVGRGERVR